MKTAGTITWLFGKNYIWTVSDAGNLELISVERMNAAVREVRDALREGMPRVVEALRGLDGEQQV